MSDISNILVAVCGFGCVCCGSFVLGFGLLVRVFGMSLILPAISAVSSVIFNRDGDDDDPDDDFDAQSVGSRGPSNLQARIQAANQQFAQSLDSNVSASAQSFSAQDHTPRGVQRPPANQPPDVRSIGVHQQGRGSVPGQSPFDIDPKANMPYGSNIRQGGAFNPGGTQPSSPPPPQKQNRFGVNPSLDSGQGTGPSGQPLSGADRLRQRGHNSDLGQSDLPGIRRRKRGYDSEEEYFGSQDEDDNGLLDFFE